jgi:putative hemolysin
MDSGPESIMLEFGLIFILIMLNAFFAASEIAVISLNKGKMNYLAVEGDKKAQLLLKLLEEPSKFLATIQVGITLGGFLASASAAVSVAGRLSDVLKQVPVPFITGASEEIALIVVTVILSFITLVLGELVPKRLALQNAEGIAMFSIKPIMFISKITSPFVRILTGATDFFVRVFGGNSETTNEKVTKEEIRMMIDVGEESGIFNETEKEMIDGIFEFDNTLAREVMTPRTNVFMIDVDTPIEEVLDSVLEEQYSRVPVYDDETDNIIGILYMKDLFVQMRKGGLENISIRELIRPAYFVPDTKNTDVLFRELQKSNNHMAILIDEYGGFEGIVTIEDLIEEIVGNIFDEYDEGIEQDEYIHKIDQSTFIVNGLVSIDEINEKLDLNLPSEHFDTVGGFVINLMGNIPKEDEENIVEYEDMVFKVEKVNEKRIELLKISLGQPETLKEKSS